MTAATGAITRERMRGEENEEEEEDIEEEGRSKTGRRTRGGGR